MSVARNRWRYLLLCTMHMYDYETGQNLRFASKEVCICLSILRHFATHSYLARSRT